MSEHDLPELRHYAFIQSWQERARSNVDEWGMQNRETLLLAMQEELGELTRSTLEEQHESGDYQQQYEELADLAALVIQYQHRLEQGPEGDDA